MPLSDALVLGCLLTLLVVAVRHPSGRVETGFAAGAVAVTLATGILTGDDVRRVVDELGPVLVFLVAILVVADVCARAGCSVGRPASSRCGRGRAGSGCSPASSSSRRW